MKLFPPGCLRAEDAGARDNPGELAGAVDHPPPLVKDRNSGYPLVSHQFGDILERGVHPDMMDVRVMILDANYRTGMTCYTSVHGTEAPPDYCPQARLLMDGQAHSQQICEPRLGWHFLISVSPLHAPDGALIGSIHAARDITAVKMAEEMSRLYSHDLERLLAVSQDITTTTDLKSLYRFFVSTARDLLALDFSTLLLLSEDIKTLTVQDCLGFPESMIGRFTLVEGQGLSTLVVKSKKPVIVADFTGETRFEVPPIVWEKKSCPRLRYR